MRGCLIDQVNCVTRMVNMEPNIRALQRRFPPNAIFITEKWFVGLYPIRVWININATTEDSVTIVDSKKDVIARGSAFITGYSDKDEWTNLPDAVADIILERCKMIVHNSIFKSRAENHLLLAGLTKEPDWKHSEIDDS